MNDHDPTDYYQTAVEWHGGQWSAMYSFLSTGATVHGQDHADELLSEIERDIQAVESNPQSYDDPDYEIERLQAFANYVQSGEWKA